MTSQIPNYIVFTGLRHPLYSPPSPFPPRFELPPMQFFLGEDHSNVRGYGVIWEVENERLFVIAFSGTIETSLDVNRKVGMQEVYGTDKPVRAK